MHASITTGRGERLERVVRLAALAAILAAIVYVAATTTTRWVDRRQLQQARSTVQALLDATPDQLPQALDAVEQHRRWTEPLLNAKSESWLNDSNQRLRVALGKIQLGVDAGDWVGDLLQCQLEELIHYVNLLKPHQPVVAPSLWTVVENRELPPDRRLRAAGVVAALGPLDAARWGQQGAFVAEQLVATTLVQSDQFGPWSELFRSVGPELLDRLASVARDRELGESERLVAARYFSEFAGQEPQRLAELLADADAAQVAEILPRLQSQSDRLNELVQSGWPELPTRKWQDVPLPGGANEPDAAIVAALQSAGGMLQERFAFCQTLPLAEFRPLAEALGRSGYRPTRLRPYSHGDAIQVAAVWARDGRAWQLAEGVSVDELRRRDPAMREQGLKIADVSAYFAKAELAETASPQYAVLWGAPADPAAEVEYYVGVERTEHLALVSGLKRKGMRPRTLHVLPTQEDRALHCGIWVQESGTSQAFWSPIQLNLEQELDSERLIVDLGLFHVPPPPSTEQRFQRQVAAADEVLRQNPADVTRRYLRATAYQQLRNDQAALEDLNWLVANSPAFAEPYAARALVLARQGKADEARADLDAYRQRKPDPSFFAYYVTVVAAHLGQEAEALSELEAALDSTDNGFLYNACCTYSIVSGLVAGKDAGRSKVYAERAIELLERSVELGYREYAHMETDPDLDPIREHPRFVALLQAQSLRWRYPYVSVHSDTWEAASVYRVDPKEHLAACQRLIEQGYRPVSVAVAAEAGGEELQAASVWHRPRLAETALGEWARRQATVAALRVRSGHLEELGRWLSAASDIDVRCSLIHQLASLGTPADLVLSRLRTDSDPAVRAALLQSLGEYSPQEVPPSLRNSWLPELLNLYRSDPDREVHGSVKWLLVRWGFEDRLNEVDRQVGTRDRVDSRQWYVNGQGQTMVLIGGPAEFFRGSPAQETGHADDEAAHTCRIAQPFSLCGEEVTVGQFQRFLREQPQFRPGAGPGVEPHEREPQTGVSWYTVAAYCNWLSQQEGLPEDQWCYQPNDAGQFGEGMRPTPGYQQRRGYRLPSEAEWEYACRAGVSAPFSFGRNPVQLNYYGWSKVKSGLQVQRVGQLKPNRWGLSDMHGNAAEWCHGRYVRYDAGRLARDEPDAFPVSDSTTRVLRGGSFANRVELIRSAARTASRPGNHFSLFGFRVARTE